MARYRPLKGMLNLFHLFFALSRHRPNRGGDVACRLLDDNTCRRHWAAWRDHERTNTVGLMDGGFSVTDGKVTCSGSYNALNKSRTITIPVVCTDGRTGIVTATRNSPMSGGGKVRLSDGTEADFIFGEAARRI